MASFNSAFAAARKAGKGTFTWNGKSYNTKVAKGNGTPAKAPRPTSRPVKLPDTAPVPAKKPSRFPDSMAAPSMKSSLSAKKVDMKMPAPSAKNSGNPMSTLSKIKNSVRIGATAVERGHRRDAAMKANKK